MWKLFAEVAAFFLIMLKFSSGFAANGEEFWKDDGYDFSKIQSVIIDDIDTSAETNNQTEIQEKYKSYAENMANKLSYKIISVEEENLVLENLSGVADILILAKVDNISTETQHFSEKTYTVEREVPAGRERPNKKKYGDGLPPKRYRTIKETVTRPAYDADLIYLTIKFEVYDIKTKKLVMTMTGQRTGGGNSTNIKMYDQIFKKFFNYFRKTCK